MKKFFPKSWSYNFKGRFIEAHIESPDTDNLHLRLKWNFTTEKYSLTDITPYWSLHHPTSIPHLQNFLAEVNKMPQIDPMSIDTYDRAIDTIFRLISLSILLIGFLLSFFDFTLNHCQFFGKAFWIWWISGWLFTVILVRRLVEWLLFRVGDSKWRGRQQKVYLLCHKFNIAFFTDLGLKIKPGESSAYFTLRV